jgi:hypothetical protein
MSDFGWGALVIIAYVALVGVAVYLTKSGWPLWALLLVPSISTKRGEK